MSSSKGKGFGQPETFSRARSLPRRLAPAVGFALAVAGLAEEQPWVRAAAEQHFASADSWG